MVPSHYLNQCLNIVNWTLSNKLQRNFNWNSNIFIEENTFENVIWKMAAILSQPQCDKKASPVCPKYFKQHKHTQDCLSLYHDCHDVHKKSPTHKEPKPLTMCTTPCPCGWGDWGQGYCRWPGSSCINSHPHDPQLWCDRSGRCSQAFKSFIMQIICSVNP